MSFHQSYACIAIVDWQLSGVAIETVSIIDETCSLSGAWYLEENTMAQAKLIVADCLLIEIGVDRPIGFAFNQTAIPVRVDDFLNDAKHFSRMVIESYNAYLDLNPKKRKTLVEPNFTNWPETIDIKNPKITLKTLGRAQKIRGTDPEMELVLSASRLVKWMVDGWLHDEVERSEKPYLPKDKASKPILPPSWMLAVDKAINVT